MSSHRVQFAADAKGKIEREHQYWQGRLPAYFASEQIKEIEVANPRMDALRAHRNAHEVHRELGQTPQQAWAQASKEKRNRHRPVPAGPLLDLHPALYVQRRLNADSTLDFLGRNWPVTPVPNKVVTVVHHPGQCFWVIPPAARSRPPRLARHPGPSPTVSGQAQPILILIQPLFSF